MNTIMLIAVVAGLFLAISWILMPFFIVGTNNRLDRMIRNQERLIKHLGNRRMAEQDEAPAAEPARPVDPEEAKKDTMRFTMVMAAIIGLSALLYLLGYFFN